MWPAHLKAMVSESLGGVAKDLLDALVMFYNQIVFPGHIPESVRPVFFGAKLFALGKKNGGVRPIAIGLTLRRLGGKLSMGLLQDLSRQIFRPYQLGVAVQKGAEIAVHSARKFTDHEDRVGRLLIKIDYENAFNSVERDKILEVVREAIPGVYPFVYQSYARKSNLFYGDDVVESAQGVQQGDPLGPLLFSLAIINIVKRCTLRFLYKQLLYKQ
jgi:hypothetical protein